MSKKKKLFKLPKEFAEKWFESLLSGDYKQGSGQLCEEIVDDDHEGDEVYEYCCLGVALISQENDPEKKQYINRSLYTSNAGYIELSELPSNCKTVASKIPVELTFKDGDMEEGVKLTSLSSGSIIPFTLGEILAKLNDGTKSQYKEIDIIPDKQYTFKEIVDWGKENVELY